MSYLSDYTFPFNTCEKPQTDNVIAQPYSFLTNLVCTFWMLSYYPKAKFNETKNLILSYTIFEFVHALCHAFHFDQSVQSFSIHFLFYSVSFTSYKLFVKLTNVHFTLKQYIMLSLIILNDIYVFFKIGGGWIIISGISILVYIVVSFNPYFPQFFFDNIKKLLVAAGLSQLFLINEIINCNTMMEMVVLPYHVILELFAVYIFISLVKITLIWEKLL